MTAEAVPAPDRLRVIEDRLLALELKSATKEDVYKLRDDLTWRMLGMSGLIIAGVGIIEKVIHG